MLTRFLPFGLLDGNEALNGQHVRVAVRGRAPARPAPETMYNDHSPGGILLKTLHNGHDGDVVLQGNEKSDSISRIAFWEEIFV